ncbi:MAG: hypothetical protein ACREDP_02185, partial [Bradyrhizobium sp.]
DTFSSREPVSTSLENALEAALLAQRLRRVVLLYRLPRHVSRFGFMHRLGPLLIFRLFLGFFIEHNALVGFLAGFVVHGDLLRCRDNPEHGILFELELLKFLPGFPGMGAD